jgi:hypothetical protein
MGRQALGLIGTSFGLIALYLVLTQWVGARAVLGAAGGAYVNVIKALQGR